MSTSDRTLPQSASREPGENLDQRVSTRDLEENLLTASPQPAVIACRLFEGRPDRAPKMHAPHAVVKQKAKSVEEKFASTMVIEEKRKHALQRAALAA